MPTLTINGRQVSVDDSFLSLPREEQDATVEEIAKSIPSPEPSGAYAGAKHGIAQLVHGVAETAKQNFGLGDGFDNRDPNYVPADPYKPSQWGQLLTENIPSMGAAIAGGKAAAAMAPGKWKIPAALLGATGAGWLMSSGDTIKERAANNGRVEPNLQDKVIGNLTSGAASAAGAVPAARLVPGLNKVAGAGASAAVNAGVKALTTLGSGAAGGAAADLANQVGTTAGTDQGLTVDPSRLGGSAITGGLTSGALAVAPLTGDLIRAGTLRKFVGDNEAASKNYATRLEAAGNGDLGNAKVDETSHQRVMGDLKSELGAAAANVRGQVPSLSPEADNALRALQRGDKVNPDEIARIERETAGAPDGANAALLARTLHVADMASERGGHRDGRWSGGISGAFDRNVGYMLNPFRSLTGAAATGLGIHLLGTSSPQFAAAAYGTYGAARMVDNLTGMRSPAKTFAEHFADRNATLRVPPSNAQPPAPPPPGGGAQGPWGPRPLPQQTVPQAGVQPPQPQMPITPGTLPWQAPQVAQLPNINPVAASMLAQKLKAGLPPAPEPQAPAAPQAAPQIDPLNLPSSITKSAKNLMGGMSKVQEIRQQEQARAAVAQLPSPAVEGAPLDVTQNPQIGKRASQLVSASKALAALTRDPEAEVAAAAEVKAQKDQAAADKAQAREAAKAQSATERAQAMAERAKVKAEASAARAEQVKQKEAAKAELSQAKAAAQVENAKVKAAAAKVKAAKVVSPEQPKAEAPKADKPYEPIPDELLNRKGLEDGQVAAREVADYAPHLREKYAKNIVFRRSTLRNRLEDIAGEANDVDSSAIGRLYHQMDHSHSQRDVQRHLAHWTAKMDPATKQAIHAAVAPLLKLWKE